MLKQAQAILDSHHSKHSKVPGSQLSFPAWVILKTLPAATGRPTGIARWHNMARQSLGTDVGDLLVFVLPGQDERVVT